MSNNEADAKCLRNLSWMSAGLFALFLALVGLARVLTG